MNKKSIALGIFVSLCLGIFLAAPPAFAAKKRIRSLVARSTGISYSSVRLSRPTNSVVVTFRNLASVRRVDYVLSYSANGIAQGVIGAFVPTGQASDSRDLYFGTCSKGVCTPHYNIRNTTLTVTTTLISGATNTKRYLIRI